MSSVKNAEVKVRALYESLKYTPKWKSLDMSEKLRFLTNIKKTLIKLYDMDKETEVNNITAEFVLDNLSERGFNRLRRLDEFGKNIEEKYVEIQMNDPEKRKQLILELRKKLDGLSE